MKLILVPTDMSETAAHALRYASALAERFDAHLLVLYAGRFIPAVDFAGTSVFIPRREELIESAREQLELHVERNVSPSIPYDARVIDDTPVQAIVELACDTGADLIVMGTHGRTGFRRLVIGSVTEAVMRLATVPVIAVNQFSAEKSDIANIVCPVTFVTSSFEAARYAEKIAPNATLLYFEGNGADLPLPQNIAEFAKETNADLIAIGIPTGSHMLHTLLHLSPCPLLTISDRSARLIEADRPVETIAAR